jgi:predicted 2-oxoglutarate/Fe(II)-dependent dioxygenase YbiX
MADVTPGLAPLVAPEATGSPRFQPITAGDIFPWITQNVTSKDNFVLDTLAGRYQLYGFFLSTADDAGRKAVDAVRRRRSLFDDLHCSFVGVTVDEQDPGRGLSDILPGVRFALDFDHKISKLCGAAPVNAPPGSPPAFHRFWVLVDPSLHVLRVFPFSDDPDAVLDAVAALPPPHLFGGLERPAPILLLPNVFEPDLCRRLIDLYEAHGGGESGVQRNGKGVLDHSFKRRKDHVLEDSSLRQFLNARIARRVAPEIEKLFFMRVKFVERHIVGCYSAADGGHFAPHRDNREDASAHRRFAVSVNLNDDFTGGEVGFPEYGAQTYKAPAGWAVVFPCAILHRVMPVTAGVRYAFLPFVYDESGLKIRDANQARAAAA